MANAYRTGLQREAHRAQAVLQKTLDRAIAEWNDIGDPEHAHIDLCAAQVRYAPWDTDNCTIYVVNGGHGGYCLECAAASIQQCEQKQEENVWVG